MLPVTVVVVIEGTSNSRDVICSSIGNKGVSSNIKLRVFSERNIYGRVKIVLVANASVFRSFLFTAFSAARKEN